MKQARHQARTAALQGLYQLDIQRAPADADVAECLKSILEEAGASPEVADYAGQMTAGAWAKRDQYDQMIAEVTDHWEVSRMAVVDRNVLRMAIYELVERPEVPARVVIDEAVEIAREFGDAETPQFVNGVLDAIWKKHPVCRLARGEPG
ncbi:MAG: transcription antitermination factor NusB [Phycisphaerae bacterium]